MRSLEKGMLCTARYWNLKIMIPLVKSFNTYAHDLHISSLSLPPSASTRRMMEQFLCQQKFEFSFLKAHLQVHFMRLCYSIVRPSPSTMATNFADLREINGYIQKFANTSRSIEILLLPSSLYPRAIETKQIHREKVL